MFWHGLYKLPIQPDTRQFSLTSIWFTMVALRFASLLLLLCTPFAVASKLPCPPNSTLPSLTAWAKNGLAGIVQATSVSALETAFDAWLSQDVNITLNGISLARADLFANRVNQGFDRAATISFIHTLEAPTVANSSEAGEVSLSFNATIRQHEITGTINLIIVQDTSLSPPPAGTRFPVPCSSPPFFCLTHEQI
ncbi:hypothetical protein C8F04DRAFT_1114735 [Mycena alexandri]|uniref:Uncharacterized protein n=1 Tax=Mycena alexandri TaxID=1745969 RepID=A0AAD6WYL7_9AGAR|nr:hypothetical protein C8F04DRAFT_1114735 [Mycena alexandri]